LLAEKKSLLRFLIIYILSTLFLISIGEYFYYKLAKNSLIQNQKIILENKIENFMKQKVKQQGIKNIHLLQNMAIFKNHKLIASNFTIPNNLDFNQTIWIQNNKIFYIKKLIRPFGIVHIVTFKKLPSNNLKEKLIIFNIFIFIFIILIAYALGKLFLSPMKENISKLEDFIRDTTHEMNTPISVIMSNIEILKLKNIEYKECNRIQNAAKRLNKIFEDLKFVTLNHSINKNITTINLKDLILERIEYFDINPEIDLEDKIIKADKEDMVRLIDNLLSNAKKYSSKFIKVTLTKSYFMVENDGEIKNIKDITKKFVRENQKEGGFGLGLYIVKKICKTYNFKLEITNNINIVAIKIILQ
jgi:two-component system OmpR family sensor kinase